MKTYKAIISLIILSIAIVSCDITELYEYPVGKGSKAEIISMSLVDSTGLNMILSSEVDTIKSIITIKIKGIDKSRLVPRAVVSEGVIIEPAMGKYTDFSSPVIYTLVSSDRQNKREWKIRVFGEFEIDLGEQNPDDYDSGFDYEVDGAVWAIDNSKSDDFDQLNSSKWSTSLWYTTSGVFAYNSNNTSVKNGKLYLTAKKESYNGKSYTAGAIKSVFQVGNNSNVKVRAKVVNSIANVASSISLYDEPSINTNPNSRIDIMQTPWAKSTANAYTSNLYQRSMPDSEFKLGSRSKFLSTYLGNDYHVYGLERRNGYIRFYFDGEVAWEFEISKYPELSTQQRSILLSIEGLAGNPVDANLSKDFVVDYVKVYNANNTPPTPTEGDNLVKNSGFELGGGSAPPSWTVTRVIGNEWTTWAYADGGQGSSASKFGVGSSSSAFDATVSQKISGLENGVYRLEAWAYIKGSIKTTYIYAKGFGGEELNATVNATNWERIVIDNIYVDNGECEIGLHSVAEGGSEARSFFDNFKLTKINF